MTNEPHQAVLLSLDRDTAELSQLTTSLDYTVSKIFIQQRNHPDVNTFLGSGKIKEIQEFLENSTEHYLIIVNGELKPSQWFNLEKRFDAPVYDRIHLILSIFEQRAQRKEAKLQVKLAFLQYERPYVRELIHRARAGEHPGLMAGGEYQVDDYYEMIKKQMKTIRQELAKIRNNRDLQRKTRYRSGFYLISLAGYTNAGKSCLLNLLSGGQVKVEGKLFSTLSTTTRRIPKQFHAHTMPILLTDTVGFIDNLPSWVIDAFHSTLEEIEVADVVLLIVDASDPPDLVQKKLHVSLAELKELNVTSPIIIVLNKIDVLTNKQLNTLQTQLQHNADSIDKPMIPISAKHNQHIDDLFDTIYTVLPQKTKLHITIPNTPSAHPFVSHLFNHTQVNDVNYGENIILDVACNSKMKDKIKAQVQDLKGTAIETEKTR